jgi:hypothetical protein
VKKQARVADDWMMSVFGLTAIHHPSSTGGVLYRTNIGKPEGTCETLLSHPTSHKLSHVTDYKLDIIAVDSVYIIKKAYQESGRKIIRLS